MLMKIKSIFYELHLKKWSIKKNRVNREKYTKVLMFWFQSHNNETQTEKKNWVDVTEITDLEFYEMLLKELSFEVPGKWKVRCN